MPELTNDIIGGLLPTQNPVGSLPEGVTQDVFSIQSEGLTDIEMRIFRWLTALQARTESERWDRRIPGFQFATYGFVPVSEQIHLPRGVKASGGYVFGVALEMEAAGEVPFQEVESFNQNGVAIARILNWRSAELDIANPVSPWDGTGACWAHSNNPAIMPAADGVLTAGHVVAGLSLRSPVRMSDSRIWHLGDRGSCKIDAALIVRAKCIPRTAARLLVQKNPLPFKRVTFHGAASGRAITARITHAQVHPTYLDASHPMRVFFDKHGIQGDSGALVQETATRLGVGVYMGRYPIPSSAGAYQGGAQALSQAQDELQLNLFI
jgi:hypothetical protein